VFTANRKKIDILAIHGYGVVYVIELKKGRTPREVVAQALDYGSWVGKFSADDVGSIYASHPINDVDFARPSAIASVRCSRRRSTRAPPGHCRFGIDRSTERIVEYLSEYEIPINVLFFRYFKDGEAEYIAPTWLLDRRDRGPH
jgi:hypothetical protein